MVAAVTGSLRLRSCLAEDMERKNCRAGARHSSFNETGSHTQQTLRTLRIRRNTCHIIVACFLKDFLKTDHVISPGSSPIMDRITDYPLASRRFWWNPKVCGPHSTLRTVG